MKIDSDEEAKQEMIDQMCVDLGIIKTMPDRDAWLNAMCDQLIRKGWRKVAAD